MNEDSILIQNSSTEDIDTTYFDRYFQNKYETSAEEQTLSRSELLESMNLARDNRLNVAGMLLFGSRPYEHLLNFIVKVAVFSGTDAQDGGCTARRDLKGRLSDVLKQSLEFTSTFIGCTGYEQSFDSGEPPEIPRLVFEELIANALIHRDYAVQAPIQLFLFSDRIEIISPGCLPHNLTVANIRMGISYFRNPILASFAERPLLGRVPGSGILNAMKACPGIDFVNDKINNRFIAMIPLHSVDSQREG